MAWSSRQGVDQLFDAPRHAYTRDLLDAALDLEVADPIGGGP